MDITKDKRVIFFLIDMWAIIFCAFADAPPAWFLPLRDAVYEQELGSGDIVSIYQKMLTRAQAQLEGHERWTVLSRCEYMMGRAFQYEANKAEASAHYEKGIEWARKSLAEQASAEAYQMLAENISQSCAVRPLSWALANGLKVEDYAKEALKLDPSNAAAQYMIAARYVYAPAPFQNYQRGIRMMQDIADENSAGSAGLQKDDLFNIYSCIGYAYTQQKKFDDARPWLKKALTVYHSNKFVLGLLHE
jgi:tetratricopeptide (TPR) repeat protein